MGGWGWGTGRGKRWGQQIADAPTSPVFGRQTAALWAAIIRYENVGLIRPARERQPCLITGTLSPLKDITANMAAALMPADKVLSFLPTTLIILFKAT